MRKRSAVTGTLVYFQLAANVLNFAKDKPELHTGSVQGALIFSRSARLSRFDARMADNRTNASIITGFPKVILEA